MIAIDWFSGVALPILIVLLLVVVNGVFVAAEFALVGSRSGRLKILADGGSRSAKWLVSVIERPTGKDGYVAIAQLGITLASIGLGMYGEPAVAHWLYGPFENLGLSYDASHTVGFIVALSAITYMHVVFGEMIPKALALQSPEATALRVNPVMRVFGWIFRPMVWLLNTVALWLMRLLRIPEPDARLSLHTSEELEIVTDEAAAVGQLGELQRDLAHNVFELERREAEELMTPRAQLETLDLTAPADVVEARLLHSEWSRFPIVRGDLDRVVGLLHAKDFIRARQRGLDTDLAQLKRPLPTVVASTTADRLLVRFRRERVHACLVVDDFGNTLGLVTFDDVIALLMGTHDGRTESVVHDDGSVTVDGTTTLQELADEHGIDLVMDEVTTVAGVVLTLVGSVPGVGATVEHDGVRMKVDAVDRRAITRVRIAPVGLPDTSSPTPQP
ncbi:MAG: hemolysin [Acidimicrobiaceae bacterium]|nr:hemolysin [Acidimicrobiaceae bacterium]